MAVHQKPEVQISDATFLTMFKSLQDELREDREVLTSLRNTLKTFMGEDDAVSHRKKHEYLDLLISRERERADMRKAIITKTLTALVWAAIVGLTIAVGHYFFPTRY